jgi:hypothetical protein
LFAEAVVEANSPNDRNAQKLDNLAIIACFPKKSHMSPFMIRYASPLYLPGPISKIMNYARHNNIPSNGTSASHSIPKIRVSRHIGEGDDWDRPFGRIAVCRRKQDKESGRGCCGAVA